MNFAEKYEKYEHPTRINRLLTWWYADYLFAASSVVIPMNLSLYMYLLETIYNYFD